MSLPSILWLLYRLVRELYRTPIYLFGNIIDKKSGAIVKLFPPEEGDNVWSAEQQQISLSLPPDDAEDRRGFSWTFGPVQVSQTLSIKSSY